MITASGASSIFFDIDLFSWLDYCMLASQGFINMSSRLLILASWIQGLFTWINGFKASSLGFMASRILYLASWIQVLFTWIHGFNT
jgi:hypothetical protein